MLLIGGNLMNITFPNFGISNVVLDKALTFCGVQHTLAANYDDKVLEEGLRITPDEICLPFKYMAGSLIEPYKNGADTVVMVSTGGPCRLGEYCQLLDTILKKEGMNYKWIILEPPSIIGWAEFYKRISSICEESDVPPVRKTEAIITAVKTLFAIDKFKRSIYAKAGYYKEPYEVVKIYRNVIDALINAKDIKEYKKILKVAKYETTQLEKNKKAKPLKILVCGEIFSLIEPEANKHIEEILINNGCCVKNHIDVSWWIKYVMFGNIKNTFNFLNKNNLRYNIGGYAGETVNKIINDKWCDGVIKIFPVGCMPEIAGKAYCESREDLIKKEILHLVYDEMKDTGGYNTRIEAFIDMLERKKDVLAGN